MYDAACGGKLTVSFARLLCCFHYCNLFVNRKAQCMSVTQTAVSSHFEDIKSSLVKITRAILPEENDLPEIIASWNEKLSSAETLDALNLWLHTYLAGEKDKADKTEEIQQLDQLEPDPHPVDTSDVSA